jgi:hypothetical protein
MRPPETALDKVDGGETLTDAGCYHGRLGAASHAVHPCQKRQPT